jgi:lysophospholipase L1-like esterase
MMNHRHAHRLPVHGLWVACLVAMGFSSIACAQGPVTVVPVPREDKWWQDLHHRFLDRAKQGKVDLLFLGDSITQGWNDNEVWKRFYGPRHAANFGIGGDATQHVLWRIRNGELEGIRPKIVVLMIGTNNASYCSADEIAKGVTAIVEELRKRLPDTKILLLGVFPRSQKPDATRQKLQAVNVQIARLDDGSRVKFLDIGRSFLNDDGSISPEIMPDYLHLSPRGYRIWADAIEPTLWSMFDEPR